MTKEQWRRRKEQWKKFHAWESKHAADSMSPLERLAEVGALVDLILVRRGSEMETVPDPKEAVVGILLMRRRLACLGQVA